jgi:hypothetical protein
MWVYILDCRAWNFSFFQVPEIKKWVWETELITDVGVNFHGDFFHNGKYRWPSSLNNARLVVKEALNYSNLYELIISEPFDSNFNLHHSISSLCEHNSDLIQENIGEDIILNSNFYSSNKTREEYFKSLNVSSWSYENVIISAICYLFENIYIKYPTSLENFYKTNKIEVFNNDSDYVKTLEQNISFNVEMLIGEIAGYLLDKQYSKQLFSVLSNTNIFRIERFATFNAFTYIFEELPKKKYRQYLKNNTNIVETLSRFFQVFQLNFIFCDSFIENAILGSINNYTNSIDSSQNLFHILNLYLSFLQKYSSFQEKSEKLLYFSETKLEISNQKLFVNAFFYNYITGIPLLEITGAVKVFKKLFPSIQFDILQHLEQMKKNDNLKKKLNQIREISGSMVGLIGPGLSAHNSFFGNSLNVSPPYATYATTESLSSQSRFVTRSSNALPVSLQRKSKTAEAMKFIQSNQEYLRKYQTALQQSKLSPNSTILPLNSIEFEEKAIKGFVFMKDSKTNLISPIGNFGSYDCLKIGLDIFDDLKISAGQTFRKAHLFCKNIRQPCRVTTGDGLCWVVPPCINQVEEHQANQDTRDYRYQPGFESSSLGELVFSNTVKSWGYICETVESKGLINSGTLDFLNTRFKNCVGDGIAQLDQMRSSLQIPENKSLFCLYTGDAICKIDELTKIVRSCGLHTTGHGKTLIKPGVLLSDACDKAYKLTQVGKTYIQQCNSPIGEQVLSNLLETSINNFCNEVNTAALANHSYRQAGRIFIPPVVLSFDEIPLAGVYADPTPNQIVQIVGKVTDLIKEQKPGNLQQALKRGRVLGVGDFRTKSKAPITQTDLRTRDQVFTAIEPTLSGKNYINDNRWIW